MDRVITILLVGIGGYGSNYSNALLDYQREAEDIRIVGVVDPRPEAYGRFSEIKERNIPVYRSIEEFYKSASADLAIVSSPIQFHKSQSVTALRHGSNVLCEKPMCATVQDGLDIIREREKSGKLLAVGYQWSYSRSILNLKEDILNGVYGKPKRLKTLVLWPRSYKYYNRNQWAGRKRDDQGNWILDSVANNATAHYLHNMFFVLGERMDRSAWPANITAELYRANNIENYDTAAMRVFTKEGVEIMFYASHAVQNLKRPFFRFEFDKANIVLNDDTEGDIIALFHDGQQKNYGNPHYGNPHSDVLNKLWMVIEAVKKKHFPCTAEAALSQIICINGAQKSVSEISCFPEVYVKEGMLQNQGLGLYVDGLDTTLEECYSSWKMPDEAKVSWARPGKCVDLSDFKVFEG